MTPADLVSAFCSWCEGPGFKRPGTARAYLASLTAFLREMKVEDLETVTPRAVDEFVARCQLEGMTVGTIRARMFAMRAFWKWATSRGHLARDPMALVRVPPEEEGQRHVLVLDASERARLFAAALEQVPVQGKNERDEFFARRLATTVGQAERDYALLTTIYAAALRCGEAAALEWTDLIGPDKRDGLLGLIVRRSKKSSVPSKPIYLGKEATAAILRWRSAARASGRYGRRIFGLTPSGISDAFSRCARAAGVAKKYGRNVTPHCLRASRATAASRAGLSEDAVRDLLRHSGTDSILRYVKAADEGTRRFEQVASLDHPELVGARRGRIAARLEKAGSFAGRRTRAGR